jgi:hypothetical protein
VVPGGACWCTCRCCCGCSCCIIEINGIESKESRFVTDGGTFCVEDAIPSIVCVFIDVSASALSSLGTEAVFSLHFDHNRNNE